MSDPFTDSIHPTAADIAEYSNTTTSALPSKLEVLQYKKEAKLEALQKSKYNKTTNNVEVMNYMIDGDTPSMRGNNIRLEDVNAYETTKDPIWQAAHEKQLTQQRLELSKELRVPYYQVTNEDVFRAGAIQKNAAQEVFGTQVDKEGKLLPSIVMTSKRVNLKPQDTSPQNNYGRDLGQIAPMGGAYSLPDGTEVNVPTAKEETKYVHPLDVQHDKSIDITGAVLSGGAKLADSAAGMVNAAIESLGEGMQWDENQKVYDAFGRYKGTRKELGMTKEDTPLASTFDSIGKYLDTSSEEARSYWREQYNTANDRYNYVAQNTANVKKMGKGLETFVDGVLELEGGKVIEGAAQLAQAADSDTVIELFAQSAPEMALTMLPIVGVPALVASKTEEGVQNWKEDHPNEEMSAARGLSIAGTSVIYALLNKVGLEHSLKPAVVASAAAMLRPALKGLSKTEATKVILKSAGKVGLSIGGATLVEGGTEPLQDLALAIGEELYDPKYKGESGVDKIVTSKKDELYQAAAAGGLMGGVTNAGAIAYEETKDTIKGIQDSKVIENAQLNSKREKAPVKSTVPKSTTKEEVRSKLVDINTKFDNKSYTTSKEVLDDVADLDTMVAGMQDEGVTTAIEQQKQYIYSKIAEEGLGEVTLGSEAEATQMIEDIVLYSEPTDNQRATINTIAQRYGIDADKIIEVAKKGITEYERLGRTLSRLNVDPVENEEKITKVISGLAAIEEANIYNQDALTEAVSEIEANIKSGTQISGTQKVTLATGQEYGIEVKDGVINPEVYKTLEGIQRNLEGIRAQYKNVNLDEVGPTVQSVVDKIVSGEKEFTPAEQQIQINNKEEVELLLKEEVYKRSEAKKGSIKEQVENSWSSTIEKVEGVPTKISNIVEINSKSKSKLSTQGIQSMSKTVSDYAKTAVDKLSKSILSVNPEVEKFKQKESPARGLMFDINGKMNENTATAIRLGLDELLAYGLDDLVPKTKADVARIMGLQEYEVKDAMLKEFQNLGLNKTILADKLGRSIAKNMGIKPNKEIDEELYARLIADLGQTAIIYGEDMGALQMQDISAARYAEIIGEDVKGSGNIGFVKPSNKYLNADRKAQRESVKRTRKRYDAIAKELSIEPDEIKTYRNEPLSPKKNHKARNNPIADVPQKVIKVLNKMRQIKHTKVESSVEWIKTNKELAMKLLGYKEDMSGHSKQVQDSQDAKNAAIEKSVEELLNTEGSEFYFDWFYSKNGRYMIDSVTTNPQSDKLHRFIIVPDSHNVELDSNDADHMNKLKYALAQAVGFPVDKKSTKDILAKGQAVLNAGSVKLEKYLHSSKAEIEHLGHYLQAIEAVKNYENRIDGKFSTNITAEFDALTSGFGIKLMQFPILKDMVRWLEKVGVYTNKSMKSMNDELSSKGFTDSYQTLASQIKRGAIQPKASDNTFGLWKELSAVLPEAVKGEAIASELRGLFKNPFMTFNYAAGMKSIKKSLSENIVDEIVEGLATGNKKYARLEYALKRHVPNLIMELQTKELSAIAIGKSNLHKELTNLVFYTYGEQVQKIMETEFSEFVEANKVINDSFKTMFTEYKKAYDKAIKEVKDSGKPITSQKKLEIIRSLRDKFPMIKGPLSETREEGVAIYSTGKQDPISQKYKSAKTQRADGRQPMIQSLVREFEEAMSAGAVIPIHFIDGAVMNKVAEMFEAQYIHDAIMPNLLEMGKAVETYNKVWYETNRDYSIIDELVDAMDKPSEGLLELQKKVQEGRKWLYEQNAEIGHMVGMEDGVYRKSEVEVEYNDEQIKIIKEFMSKPRIMKLLKDNNISIEEC